MAARRLDNLAERREVSILASDPRRGDRLHRWVPSDSQFHLGGFPLLFVQTLLDSALSNTRCPFLMRIGGSLVPARVLTVVDHVFLRRLRCQTQLWRRFLARRTVEYPLSICQATKMARSYPLRAVARLTTARAALQTPRLHQADFPLIA